MISHNTPVLEVSLFGWILRNLEKLQFKEKLYLKNKPYVIRIVSTILELVSSIALQSLFTISSCM